MKTILSAALVIGLCGPAGAQGEKADPVGTWKCEYKIGDMKRTSTLTIKKDGDKLVGTMSWPDQKETKLKDVKLKDGDLTFSAVRVLMENKIPVDYKLTITGDKLTGKGSSEFGGKKQEFDISGKREKIGAGEPTKEAKKELEKLQGDWKVVSMDIQGKARDADAIKQLKPLVIKGNEWTAPTTSGKLRLSFTIDPTKKPKELDLVLKAKPEVIFRGIYKLEGDTFTFCRAASGDLARPEDFKGGEEVILFVFKRSGK